MSAGPNQPDELPTGDNLSPLWRRIKEHRIAQWSIGYVAVAYGIQHAVTLTSEALDWPHGVERVSIILLALGLPVAMTLAWYHGERASRRISGPELSIISILLVIASLLFYVFVRPAEQIAARPSAAVVSRVAAAPTPVVTTAKDSVAVLPFLNLSGDQKEEYFSDGMTEEITSALAEVPNLPVVGRTSAFQFKGKNEDLSSIGRTLHAAYLLEGSVRKDGDEVRITAQLIKAATGDPVWTDSYDRQLKGIFAVQEDVAKAIAAALQVPLGLKQGESLVSNRDIDPESYEDYLRALSLFRSRNLDTPLTAAIALLERVVALRPGYAPAWALLSQTYSLAPIYSPVFFKGSVEELHRVADADFTKAESAARRAIQLDPRNADAYVGLSTVQSQRHKLFDAEKSLRQALSLDPLNPNALHWYGEFLVLTGRTKEAIAVREQLRTVDPLVPVFNAVTAEILLTAGDNARALSIVDALPSDYDPFTPISAEIYTAMGQYQKAADVVLSLPRNAFPPGMIETAARLLRTAPAPAPREGIPYLVPFSFVFAYVGFPERALELSEHDADAGDAIPGQDYRFWQPNFRAARTRMLTPRRGGRPSARLPATTWKGAIPVPPPMHAPPKLSLRALRPQI